jgi:hypothetical protein
MFAAKDNDSRTPALIAIIETLHVGCGVLRTVNLLRQRPVIYLKSTEV